MISEKTKRSFKRRGYIILNDILDDAVVEQAQSLIWESLPVSRDASVDEMHGRGYEFVSDVADKGPFAEIRKAVFPYAETLVGEGKLVSPGSDFDLPSEMQIPVNYPENVAYANSHLRQMDGGHVDGYGAHFRDPNDQKAGTYDYYTIGATVYLDEVKPGGGGFTVFPGSHWIAEKYYREHSLESPGWLGDLPALNNDGGWNYEEPLHRQLRATEITGPPGTVTLWHMRLLHGAGINQRSLPRLAAITRYTHHDGEEIQRDAVRNIWRYWEAMEAVDTGLETSPLTIIDD